MTNEPKDPKVVPAGDVQFDSGNAPQADSLERMVQPAESSLVVDDPWVVAEIKYLAEQVWPVLQRLEMAIAGTLRDLTISQRSPYLQGLMVQVLALDETKVTNKRARIKLCEKVDPKTLRQFLEAECHPQITTSGIYEATGLNLDEPVYLDVLYPYFFELKTLRSELLGNYVRCVKNPYATLLTLCPQVRPLLTGALREAQVEINNSEELEKFPLLPLTLRDIMHYATKVGEEKKVASYLLDMEKKTK